MWPARHGGAQGDCAFVLTVSFRNYGGLQVDASEDESEEVQALRSLWKFGRNHSHESSFRNI